jgi:hypothetical protein
MEFKIVLVLSFLLLLSLAGVAAADPAGGLLWEKEVASSEIISVSMTSDGSYVAAGSTGGSFYQLNSEGGTLWHNIAVNTWGQTRGAMVAIHPVGTYVLAGSGTKVYAYDRNGNTLWSLDTNSSNVYDVATSTDGYGYSSGSTLHFYAADDTDLFTVNTASPVWRISMAKDGSFIGAGTTDIDHRAYLYDRGGNLRWSFDTTSAVSDVAVAYNGTYTVAGAGRSVFLLDKFGVLLWRYDAGSVVNGIAISREGTVIAAGMQDGRIALLNRDGVVLWSEKADGIVFDVTLNTDGTRLAAGVGRSVYYYIPVLSAVPTPQPTAPVTTGTGTISVSSNPPGANVFVDNAYLGLTPVTLPNVATGTHTILLKKEGYSDWATTLDLSPGGTVAIKGTLSPVATPSPTRSPAPLAGAFGAFIGLVLLISRRV